MKKLAINLIGKVIVRLRPVIYRSGIRPKAGSVFYSPSLAWKISMSKAIEQTAKILKHKK